MTSVGFFIDRLRAGLERDAAQFARRGPGRHLRSADRVGLLRRGAAPGPAECRDRRIPQHGVVGSRDRHGRTGHAVDVGESGFHRLPAARQPAHGSGTRRARRGRHQSARSRRGVGRRGAAAGARRAGRRRHHARRPPVPHRASRHAGTRSRHLVRQPVAARADAPRRPGRDASDPGRQSRDPSAADRRSARPRGRVPRTTSRRSSRGASAWRRSKPGGPKCAIRSIAPNAFSRWSRCSPRCWPRWPSRLAARRFTERHLDATAVMRCIGVTQNALLVTHVSEFLIIGVCGAVLGVRARLLRALRLHRVAFLVALRRATATVGLAHAAGTADRHRPARGLRAAAGRAAASHRAGAGSCVAMSACRAAAP